MTSELGLPFGPWANVASGTWNGHPLTIYSNSAKVLLLTLFDKVDGEIKGIMVMVKKPVSLAGDASRLSPQSREITVVEKIYRDKRFKVMLLDSTPTYVTYSQQELVKAVKKQYEELEGIYKSTADFARETGVRLAELSEEESEALLGDPFSLFYVSGGAKQVPRAVGGLSKSTLTVLGADNAKHPVEVTLNALRKTFAVGEDARQRLHALHVVVENALVNNIPCIVIGRTGALSGMGLPNNNPSQFKALDMPEIANGFPLKKYALGQGLLIDLKNVDVNAFAQAAGFEKSGELVKVMVRAMVSASSLEDLAANLNNLPESKEVPRAVINKAVRAVRVMQKIFPATFGKNPTTELVELPRTAIGRIAYVDCTRQTQEIAWLTTKSVLKELYSSNSFNVLVVLEDVAENVSFEAKQALEEASAKGIGIALGASHELDFTPLVNPSLRIDLVQGNAFATEEGGEKRRFALRPSYSLCTEDKTG